jgi:uncharacterized membrane protein
VNVGDQERLLSALGGAVLAGYGLLRGTLGGLGLAAAGGALVYRGLSGHCSLYAALGVNTADRPRGPSASIPATHGVKVEKRITVNRTAADLFRFWRNFENLPIFMRHLQSVKKTAGGRSHWVAQGPLGVTVEWDAEVINEKENELIAWRSLAGSEVDTAGSVHFRNLGDGRGTEIQVVLKYDPPAGKVGAAVARLIGEAPEQQIQEDLGRFKQLMEAGAIAREASGGSTFAQGAGKFVKKQ